MFARAGSIVSSCSGGAKTTLKIPPCGASAPDGAAPRPVEHETGDGGDRNEHPAKPPSGQLDKAGRGKQACGRMRVLVAAAAGAAAAAAARRGLPEARRRRGAVRREDRELLLHLRARAVGALRRLVPADELLEVRLALHAHVFVDRHAAAQCRHTACGRGSTPTLEGRIVARAARGRGTSTGLRAAAADERVWTWMRRRRDAEALDRGARSRRPTCTTSSCSRDGVVVGSTSYLNVVPEHRRLEIGHTWNTPSAWGTGANTEAKYLLLRHAFESSAAGGSSSRPTRRTSAPARRWRRSPPSSRASTASTCRPRRRAPRLGLVRGDRRRLARR